MTHGLDFNTLDDILTLRNLSKSEKDAVKRLVVLAAKEAVDVFKTRFLELAEEAEEHRRRYNVDSDYWRGRRDEAGYFRDRLRGILR